MNHQELEKLKYPIGPFQRPDQINAEQIKKYINTIETFPTQLQEELQGLSDDQLKWKYRPEGWTIQQLIHHCADSHMNAFIRFKLAITEDNPTIKPYDENAWSTLADGLEAPIAYSEILLVGLHARWTIVLKHLTSEDLQRTFFHPEHRKSFKLDVNLALYAWHCDHHLGHIRQAKKFQGKY